MRLRILTLFMMMVVSIGVYAQNITVKGTITDENGDPIPGAFVLASGSKTGVSSDIDGKYSISVPPATLSLVFSYLSYKSQEIAIQGRYAIDVQMLPDDNVSLNEIVVIGYGTSKKSDLTGSVSTVKMSDIESMPVTSVEQAMQGRIAGVDVMSTSGEPGAASSIRIRGTRSINASNEPLVIVDGVIDAVQDMSEISSSDIQSISVMKDASSTAIYGSRGANGVILITTKKGVTSKPSVTLKAEFGVSQIARTLDVMDKDEFIRYRNDVMYFRGREHSAPAFNSADYANNTNWIKEITRIAPYQNYSVSASGKITDKFSYYTNLSYNNTRGIVDGSGFQRLTGRVNLSYNVNKWLTVALKLSASYRDEDLNKANIGGTNFWDGAIYLSPIIGPNDIVNPLYENGSAINTPRANINLVEKNTKRFTTTDVAEFTIKPVKWLTIKSQNSVMVYQRHDYQFWPSTLPKRIGDQGADAYRYEGDAVKLTSENTISASKKFSKGHKIDGLIGYSASSNKMNYFSLKAVGLMDDNVKWNNLAAITSKENLTPYSSAEQVIKQSVFARANYNYNERYYLTATVRADGSSNFAANRKWGFFPSGAFKWAVKKEPFMRNVRWIDDLSLRLSAGATGNDAISNYRSLQAYSAVTSSYPFNGTQGAAIVPDRLGNDNLTWEKTILYNAGLDMSFFKERLNISVEAYHSRTSDLLLSLQTIQSTGYTSRLTNLGLTSNTGVEVSVEGKIIEKKRFGWTANLTMTHNRQTVLDIGQEDYVSVLNSPGNTPFMMYGYKAGYPLNSLWGFEYKGVWHNEAEVEQDKTDRNYVSSVTIADAKALLGYPRYADQDHDGILSEKDLVNLGNSDPILYGGLMNSFYFGNLKLDFFFSYSIGGQIYNYSELSMAGSYASNQYRYMLNAWHPVRNPESDLPRAGTDDRLVPSSLQVHDASYLRLKSASISYKFDLSKKTKAIRDITLTLSGTNLFLITPYNGFDPDVSTNSSESTLRRVDMGAYPQSRTVVLGAQIRF